MSVDVLLALVLSRFLKYWKRDGIWTCKGVHVAAVDYVEDVMEAMIWDSSVMDDDDGEVTNRKTSRTLS